MHLQALPALSDNYIWLLRDERGTLVVDPGEADPVLEAADAGGFDIDAVLLTHHHGDHIGGTARLRGRWPRLEVLAPADPRIDCATATVADGDRLEVAGFGFEVIAVPGHTRSHIAWYHEGEAPLLFCGDTLFSLGCGRMFEGTPSQMHHSLSRLAALPAPTRVCCGHEYTLANAAFALAVEPGNAALRRRQQEARLMREHDRPTLPGTIAEERACNPFLRCDAAGVAAAAAHHAGRQLQDPVDVFAALRQWKDTFVA